jgi:hypothetical protein
MSDENGVSTVTSGPGYIYTGTCSASALALGLGFAYSSTAAYRAYILQGGGRYDSKILASDYAKNKSRFRGVKRTSVPKARRPDCYHSVLRFLGRSERETGEQ